MGTGARPQPRPAAVVALVGLEPASAEVFRAAFRQFDIETDDLGANPLPALLEKKFEGCVLRLNPDSPALLEAVRRSQHNRNIAFLGVSDGLAETLPMARLGLNAIVRWPVQRADALRAVHGTQLLILHELRRFVRVPIVLEVTLKPEGGHSLIGLTRDISYGGVSVSTVEAIFPDRNVETAFALPQRAPVAVDGRVVWRHNPELIGIRFSIEDPRRREVRRWIDEYLEFF
jgi:hypothetical protein